MKSIWQAQDSASTAEDIVRLQQQVQFLDIAYYEVAESDRLQSIRKRWRLFAAPLRQPLNETGLAPDEAES